MCFNIFWKNPSLPQGPHNKSFEHMCCSSNYVEKTRSYCLRCQSSVLFFNNIRAWEERKSPALCSAACLPLASLPQRSISTKHACGQASANVGNSQLKLEPVLWTLLAGWQCRMWCPASGKHKSACSVITPGYMEYTPTL